MYKSELSRRKFFTFDCHRTASRSVSYDLIFKNGCRYTVTVILVLRGSIRWFTCNVNCNVKNKKITVRQFQASCHTGSWSCDVCGSLSSLRSGSAAMRMIKFTVSDQIAELRHLAWLPVTVRRTTWNLKLERLNSEIYAYDKTPVAPIPRSSLALTLQGQWSTASRLDRFWFASK